MAGSQREMPVLLDGWILGDGNYSDFVAGTGREFALTFHVPWDRPLALHPQGRPGWEFTGSAGRCRITGDVVFASLDEHGDGCIVIDFGTRAFTRHRLPIDNGADIRVGDRVTGLVSLGVDPFFYVEELTSRWPDIPELIYTWAVHRVEMDESPVIEISADDPRYPPYMPSGEGPIYRRDEEREHWRQVDRTRQEDDTDGWPVYRLRCTPTGEPPTRDFRFPRR